MIAAFLAQRAVHEPGVAVVARRFEDAHFGHGKASFVEHAEHGVAVDDETRDVGDRGREGLLFARTRHEGHEVAQGFGIIEEFAQFHADPGRVHDSHVERQDAGEAVERPRVVARKPDRVGTGDAVGQGDFFQAEYEILARGRVVDVDRPGKGAVGAGSGFFEAEQGIEYRGRSFVGEGAELFAAVAHDLGEGRDHAGDEFFLAMRREGEFKGFFAHGQGEGVELEFEPGMVVGAHVHRQCFGDRAQAARLIRAVDPDLERKLVIEHVVWRVDLTDLADEKGKTARGCVDHVRPGHVSAGQRGATRPAQAGEHRGRQALDGKAAVGVRNFHVLRLFLSGGGD